MSVVNVLFTTEGLFLTLGNMMPPLRDTGLVDEVEAVDADEDDELLLVVDDVADVVEEVVVAEEVV